ncbi:hypothetical protein NP233_g3744 [Leucocoprinus birnbaumii]|uniref:Uncharacterized protein n=1 Tax=Leucocoprinus birnbaumii TaxID=56174 RepID=A0AAD5YXR8_9AGAR|nr:hypothetical protein NP233_g3744 [Leucocoprinus birnbaumii]
MPGDAIVYPGYAPNRGSENDGQILEGFTANEHSRRETQPLRQQQQCQFRQTPSLSPTNSANAAPQTPATTSLVFPRAGAGATNLTLNSLGMDPAMVQQQLVFGGGG